jgi:hypothetical protein
MMNKKFLISTVAVFVVWMLGSFLVHGLWLQPTYDAMTNIIRPVADQERLMPFMLLAHLLMSGAFVWIYQRGNEDKPWAQQGLRFGIAIALLAPIPTFMIYYVVQQEAASLAIKQSAGDSVVVIVVALVAAFLNRKSA